MIQSFFVVAAGGAVGAGLRYIVNVGAMRMLGPAFPYGTVFINVTGSFVMGVLVVVLAQRGAMQYAPFLMTGILGGFTTFSAFSLDTVKLYESGQPGLAALYVIATVVLGLAGLFAGMALARGVIS